MNIFTVEKSITVDKCGCARGYVKTYYCGSCAVPIWVWTIPSERREEQYIKFLGIQGIKCVLNKNSIVLWGHIPNAFLSKIDINDILSYLHSQI